MDFQIGDRVEWNSAGGRIRGVIRGAMGPVTTFKDREAQPSTEAPRYLIEVSTTGDLAVQKGPALKKVR